MTRRGFVLLEILVSLVLLALVGALVVAVVQGAVRTARHSMTLLSGERTVWSIGAVLREELRNADSAAVALPQPTALQVDAPIGEGAVCGNHGDTVFVRRSDWSGPRLPEATTDVAATLTDPITAAWDTAVIAASATAPCPLDGTAALRLVLAHTLAVALMVRVYSPTEVSIYESGGSAWLGLRSLNNSATVQPFAGPLMPGSSRFQWNGPALQVLLTPASGRDTTLIMPLGSPR
jgi:prepilin-type N-terminal cleavage/methylation domain-containing protein